MSKGNNITALVEDVSELSELSVPVEVSFNQMICEVLNRLIHIGLLMSLEEQYEYCISIGCGSLVG